jgi:uncharacterized protein
MPRLRLLPGMYAVCRLDASAAIPAWATAQPLFAITRTAQELSIVCQQTLVPQDVQQQAGWRVFEVEAPLDFALTGVLASLARPLADAGIPIFVLSTYDTDYLLVSQAKLEPAQAALRAAGHTFV